MPSLQDTYNYTFLGGLGQRFVQFWGLEVDLTTIIHILSCQYYDIKRTRYYMT